MMSDDEEEFEQPSLLDGINVAIGILQDLKKKVTNAGENEVLAATSVLRDVGDETALPEAIKWLRTRAERTADDIWDQLVALLENYSTWDEGEFWDHFHGKLRDLGTANIDFRRKCLFRSFGYSSTLFHEVCKLNPPANVVQTLIDITPPAWEQKEKDEYNRNHRFTPIHCEPGQEFNHLARAGAFIIEYPLDKVMRRGGSLELVKVLVRAELDSLRSSDKDKGAIHSSNDCRDSVFHVLVANKANHPVYFSEILRHLILSFDLSYHSSPLVSTNSRGMIPLEVLWESMKNEGLSDEGILQNDDFAFLLKATCYHYQNNLVEGVGEHSNQSKEIEQVPFAQAFLICSPCFGKELTNKVLEDLFAKDTTFILKKETNGKYPIHRIITNDSYLVKGSFDFQLFLLQTILRIAPLCAKQRDDYGLLPLHVAANPQRVRYTSRHKYEHRLSVLNVILKAYPEALSVIDSETGLPPFALPVLHENKYKNRGLVQHLSLSSTYFLLRQQPDMLSGIIASLDGSKLKATSGNSKKRQRTSNPSKQST
mmetsp:Transcript_35818/g.61072  ORF Transcript_35818/g.61072 Transcript_35818/m.61072 type:complete len:540 (-) Transcript_35818:262-1881(-)|eukprot:CAMPEP_0183727310 /NCGR_PEP_ID=MMETSP0737-20130205/25369_1 /TAXON_ID=385413 /ORGANISM="Thalassiosira miniscula, Strain CCMP1093" /LENGTH=539 /DNA_ID=CAMNT_0025958907 /DNA_START=184 /DNA_END=1803 /DNA_ORIENTATION=+